MRLYCFIKLLRSKQLITLFLFCFCVLVLHKVFVFISKAQSSYTEFILLRSDSIRKLLRMHYNNEPRRSASDSLKQPAIFTPVFENDMKLVNKSKVSFCYFKYGTDTLNWTENVSYSPELGADGPYRVIYNVIEGQFKFNNTEPEPVSSSNVPKEKFFGVTYCTHATPTFLYHIVEIVRRWDGLVSIAVFVPGSDAFLSLVLIEQLCHCVPEMAKISLHFIFPAMHPPVFRVSRSSNYLKDCSVPYAFLNKNTKTYKEQNGIVYPVNVARNVARVGAISTHVLVSDVELLPSRNLVPQFLSMVSKFQPRHSIIPQPSFGMQDSSVPKYVFVLPVFEVESSESDVPRTKQDLLRLYGESKAVYFHRWVCLHCQRFPGLQRWLRKKPGGSSLIKPLLIVRREFPYHRWEPVYIGTSGEPLYSELLSWEGQQDKMTQMNEMCLLGYRFVILDTAFLVHTPGIKRRSDLTVKQTEWRKPHEQRNVQIYESIVEALTQKYEGNKRCKVN